MIFKNRDCEAEVPMILYIKNVPVEMLLTLEYNFMRTRIKTHDILRKILSK
jgi:hypothetical protein